jgi:crotonobetainyl-CoA:carnitine CoA-transferase CaiB-like acyl-CoA transferase
MMHSAPEVKQDARSVIEKIWGGAGLAADALNHLTLSGNRPALATSFQVAVAAQSAIACAALAGAELGRQRSGVAQGIQVDMAAAEFECTGYFTVDGRVPDAWAPLSGLYPCRDGHVRIHANFDHHRDGALALLGLRGNPESYQKAHIQAALQDWDAEAFETAAAEAGLVVAAARTFAEWDAHPQAAVLNRVPLFTVAKIDEADPAPLPSISERNRPLTGVRVLDLTRILAGPVCGRTLAAYGADVMLINSPNLPNIEAIADTSRGKLSAHLDLDRSPDVERLRQLITGAHVFVQGYRPDGLDQRGFSPKDLALLRPGIVCVSLSAYGHEGPWAARRGFDSLVQTATGLNKAEAEAFHSTEPKPLPVQILDYAAGFLMAYGAQAALIRQTVEGGSWHVRVSLGQVARWLRGLGRLDDNLQRRKLDREGLLKPYPSQFGVLKAMPHAALFDRTPAIWRRPSVPPGTNPPEWPAN